MLSFFVFEKRGDAGHCIRAEQYSHIENAIQVCTSSICIKPEPLGIYNFLCSDCMARNRLCAGVSGCMHTSAAGSRALVAKGSWQPRLLVLRAGREVALAERFSFLDLNPR